MSLLCWSFKITNVNNKKIESSLWSVSFCARLHWQFPTFLRGFMAIPLTISGLTLILSSSSLSLCSHPSFCIAVQLMPGQQNLFLTVSSIIGSCLMDRPRKLWMRIANRRSNLSSQSPRAMLREGAASVHAPNKVPSDSKKTDRCGNENKRALSGLNYECEDKAVFIFTSPNRTMAVKLSA